MTEFHPVETISPGSSAEAMTDVILVCDHARNAIPPDIGSLGVPAADMARHIAFDIGARAVTLGLAARLGAGAVLSTYSRLVIDPNRGEDDPTLIMRIYDGTIIPGNRNVGPEERARRIAAYHRPYHDCIDDAITAVIERERTPILVSVHSFTPALKGRPVRPWHVGVLWDRDPRLARPMLRELGREQGLTVGDNEPYSGQLRGDCMWRHGTARGLPHALIEIRNDLIATRAGQADWVDRLARVVADAVAAMSNA